MNENIKFTVTEIQRFCMHDGPGVRTTVFFKGCPLKCEWCHNVETQNPNAQLCFYEKLCIGCGACVSVCKSNAHKLCKNHEVDREKCVLSFECVKACPSGALKKMGEQFGVLQLCDILQKDKAFYCENGGITLSGGEPFYQGEKIITLLKELKNRGLNVAVETCGFADFSLIEKAIPLVDLFLWDVKDSNDVNHKHYTGVSNKLILNNLKKADFLGAKTLLRCILVAGVNTNDTHYKNLANLALSLKNCKGVQFLPYHAYGGSKATFLGLKYNGNNNWIPTQKQIDNANEFLRLRGVKVITD